MGKAGRGWRGCSSSSCYSCKQHFQFIFFQWWVVHQLSTKYHSNGLYAHRSYIFNNFNQGISEYKGVLHCEEIDSEECPDYIMDAPLSQPFFTRRMKMLGRPDGFMMYDKLRVDFFSTSALLCWRIKINLRLIRAIHNFLSLATTPTLVLELLVVHFKLVVLLSRMIITRNAWICLLTRLQSSTIWELLQRLSSFLPDKTSSLSTRLQFVGSLLQWIQTLHSLHLILKIHSGINNLSQTN